jgi:tetratricopeptide (TPR) repeat protein
MGIDLRQWDAARELFEGALARTPEERTTYLETACPSDPAMRRDVLQMVAHHEQDPTFLDTPVLERILTTPLLSEGESVDGRFRIVRCVGIGGMGEVYEALDLQHPDHPERVALKILRPGLARMSELSLSLRRDIQLAHRITHPNVCKVHFLDVDRRPEGDLLFLVMDFLEGETLRARLRREGPLDEAFARPLAEQIAAGIDEAHREGVIHRDLKSSNVMLVPRKDGTIRAVITDFGIAATEDEEFKPGIGTLDYMAPERLTDAGSTRASDVYSFGVLLYEMVTGRLPFESGLPLEDRRTLPPPPRKMRPGLSRRSDRAILRCLDPVPEKRFARATQAVNAMRPPRWIGRVAVAAVAAAVMLLIGDKLIDRAARSRLAASTDSVAILPFDVGPGARLQAGLVDYLAESLQRSPLLRKKWLVFSPAEARQMGVTTPAKAAAAFGVPFALAGSINTEGASVIVEGRLIETATGRVSRAFSKTCSLDNQVCLQDGLLAAIGGALDPQGFSPPEVPRISKDALPYYVQGMEYLRRDAWSYDLAIDFFQRARAADPSAVLPQIGLAEAYTQRYSDTGDTKMLDAARDVLESALPAHPDLPELYAALANVHRTLGRYDDATREVLKAIQADPSNPAFLKAMADTYAAARRDDDASAAYERLISLQPRYWGGYHNYAIFHYNRGRYEEAARQIGLLLQWSPDHAQALAVLGAVYVAMGRNAEAENVSRRSCSLKPSRSCYINLGLALQRERRTPEAIAEYKRALAFGTPNEALLLNIADAYAFLGERTDARDYFQRAIARLQERVSVNVQNSALRAMLAYCLAHIGDPSARFEIEQALQHSPADRTVQRYGVLTFESLGQRERALEVLKSVTPQVLDELEASWGTDQMRRDPLYAPIAAGIRAR